MWTCGCVFDRSLDYARHMTLFADKNVIEGQEIIITKSRLHQLDRDVLSLNEKVGFKIPTRAIAIIIFCAVCYTVVLQSWTSGVGWSSGPLGV